MAKKTVLTKIKNRFENHSIVPKKELQLIIVLLFFVR